METLLDLLLRASERADDQVLREAVLALAEDVEGMNARLMVALMVAVVALALCAALVLDGWLRDRRIRKLENRLLVLEGRQA